MFRQEMDHDVGFLKWKDPNKWMEAMRGAKWLARMKAENEGFMREVDTRTAARVKKSIKASAEEAEEANKYSVDVGSTHIEVVEVGGGSYEWSWKGKGNTKESLAGDLDVTDDGRVVYTEDVKAGGLHYKICARNREGCLWTFDGRGRHGLSSDVAILGGRVYALEAESPLNYKWLVSVDLDTGKDRRVHYEEKGASTSLALIRGENKCLFLRAENGGRQSLYHVGLKGGVKKLSKDGLVFYAVGYASGSSDPCYYVRDTFDAPWRACGGALERMSSRLPKEFFTNGISLVNLRDGLIVHKKHGMLHFEGVKMAPFVGEIGENRWHGGDYRVILPGKGVVRAEVVDGRLVMNRPIGIYGSAQKYGTSKSEDGSSVSWFICWDGSTGAKALLVVGYGAYGSSTTVGTSRWRPYIEKGFAVGFAFVRGGGDYNDAWAEAGRREGKLLGVQDFEACVKGMQGAVGLGAEKTCIFGRSAGGYLIGTTIMRNPEGGLAKYAYTESPYVDVLVTAASPEQPLTPLEYLEFGDPAHNIYDFQTLLELSPIHAMTEKGAPGVFVLCRVGLNDRQVFPYESVKWMDALRGSVAGGEKKILYLTKGVGHNAHGDCLYTERAEDFSILLKVMC